MRTFAKGGFLFFRPRKIGLSRTGFIAICILVFASSQPTRAGVDPPAPQCCARIFSAGLEMGWAQATALYSDVSDNEISDHLNRAGGHIQGAYNACSAINPAWSGFRHMVRELRGLADRLRRNPTRKERLQISNRLNNMYAGYADSLRNQIVASQKVHMDTCGANYFLFGNHLGWAHYTFQVASDPGLNPKQAREIRDFGLRRLSWARRTLDRLEQVRAATGSCVQLWRHGYIQDTLNQMLNGRNLSTPQLVRMTQGCWEETFEAMTNGIPRFGINSCAQTIGGPAGRRPAVGSGSRPGGATSGGGAVPDYRNSGTHFSCKQRQNQEGKCCCFTGSHTYRFAEGRVGDVIAQFDTGKKLDCRSTVKFAVHTAGKWVTLGTFDAVSSRGGNTHAPNKVSVSVNRIIDGFRMGDGCRCCIDSSEIWLR